jgi:acyl-CoA synthetase (AMP-forming)/AMP-acid ligase II
VINTHGSRPEEVTSIGKGVGLVTWVVDPENHNCLLPPGYISELLLEGPLVGSGYLNDPDKTAAAFVEDPTWLLRGVPGRSARHGRLYKTGDLVRYSTDRSLIYVGRKDTQVKICGQRVELGEVEYQVQEVLPEARHVVTEVIMPQGRNSSPTLAAFLAINDNSIENNKPEPNDTVSILPITAHIKERLTNRLPNYMILIVLFSMKELPMTRTGKTDRRQLHEIGASFSVQQLAEIRTAGQVTKRQPTCNTEKRIQRI